MTRLLYISPGLVPPGSDPALDKFTVLSEAAEGEVLLPVWWRSPEDALPHLKPGFPVYQVGRFRYHFFLTYRYRSAFQRYAKFFFYLRRGTQLHRQQKFDAIVVYGSNSTGIAAVILKWLTGAKLIAEIPGVPEDAFVYESAKASRSAVVKRFFANRLLNLVGGAADCVKLLYPWQLDKYPKLRKKKAAVFHDFVPVKTIASKMQPEYSNEKYVLLVGFPWYRKGVDILIRAFKSIAAKFPDYTLKLLGHYPDRTYLNELAEGCQQIEFLRARSNEESLKIFAGCTVYVSASRTEAMGRVLLEAMAARKPIVASKVSGIPHYVMHNDNGLLFESENVEELATKLSMLLGSRELRDRLAQRGYERVMSEFDERAYVRAFQSMLESLKNRPSSTALAQIDSG